MDGYLESKGTTFKQLLAEHFSKVNKVNMSLGRATQLPEGDESANFFSWFLSWMDGYLEERGTTFQAVRADKQLRRGIARAA
jgi:hypothetical protein